MTDEFKEIESPVIREFEKIDEIRTDGKDYWDAIKFFNERDSKESTEFEEKNVFGEYQKYEKEIVIGIASVFVGAVSYLFYLGRKKDKNEAK